MLYASQYVFSAHLLRIYRQHFILRKSGLTSEQFSRRLSLTQLLSRQPRYFHMWSDDGEANPCTIILEGGKLRQSSKWGEFDVVRACVGLRKQTPAFPLLYARSLHGGNAYFLPAGGGHADSAPTARTNQIPESCQIVSFRLPQFSFLPLLLARCALPCLLLRPPHCAPAADAQLALRALQAAVEEQREALPAAGAHALAQLAPPLAEESEAAAAAALQLGHHRGGRGRGGVGGGRSGRGVVAVARRRRSILRSREVQLNLPGKRETLNIKRVPR